MAKKLYLMYTDECGYEAVAASWTIPFDDGDLTDAELGAMKGLYLSRAFIPEEARSYWFETDYQTAEDFEAERKIVEAIMQDLIAEGYDEDDAAVEALEQYWFTTHGIESWFDD